MEEIRFINSVYKRINQKGLAQTVTEYTTQAGNLGTKIVTDLGNGKEGIRTIERDFLGIPKKVIDNVYGREEVFVSAYPERPQGVFQYTEDNIRTYLPNVSFDNLCKY